MDLSECTHHRSPSNAPLSAHSQVTVADYHRGRERKIFRENTKMQLFAPPKKRHTQIVAIIAAAICAVGLVRFVYVSLHPSDASTYLIEGSGSFTQEAAEIKNYFKPFLNNYIIVSRNDDICSSQSSTTSNLEAQQQQRWTPPPYYVDREGNEIDKTPHSILPKCPTPSYPGSSFYYHPPPSSVSSSRTPAPPPILLLPPSHILSRTTIERIMIKVLKFLITNKGCDVVIDPIRSKSVKEELYETVVDDYNGEYTAMVLAALSSSTDQFIAESFMGSYFDKVRGRVNTLSVYDAMEPADRLSRRSQQQRQETLDAIVGLKLANRTSDATDLPNQQQQQPSAAEYCQISTALSASSVQSSPPPSLFWIPTESFNNVLTFDYVMQKYAQFLRLQDASEPNTAGKTEGIESQLCVILFELVRTLKVGGALWIGHIVDDNLIDIITNKCPLRFTSLCSRPHFRVEITVLSELDWIGPNVRSQFDRYPFPDGSEARSFYEGMTTVHPKSIIVRKSFSDIDIDSAARARAPQRGSKIRNLKLSI